MKGLLKSNAETFIKYCQSTKLETIRIDATCIELGIKTRRMHDIVNVLANVGILYRVGKCEYRYLGMDNLIVDDSLSSLAVVHSVTLAILTRIFFRLLVVDGIQSIDNIVSRQEKHWQKVNRRLYDILNIFEGIGIVERKWKWVKISLAAPPTICSPPPPPSISPDFYELCRGHSSLSISGDYCSQELPIQQSELLEAVVNA